MTETAPTKRVAKKTTPAKKAAAKKEPPLKAKRPNDVRIFKTEMVGVRSLNLHHNNPNVREDLDDHKRSLIANGQFRAILVNVGSKSKYPREVLAGNHTLMAAREIGWTKVRVDWVDVDDKTAARIVAADLKIVEGVKVSDDAIYNLLKQLDNLEGTGFRQEEFDKLDAELNKMASEVQQDIDEWEDKLVEQEKLDAEFDTAPLGEEPDLNHTDDTSDGFLDEDDEEYEVPDTPDINTRTDTLPGVFTLKTPSEIDFGQGLTYWGIPKLLTAKRNLVTLDMFPKLEKLKVWIGSLSARSAANNDDEQWWFLNFGSDSTKGLRNLHQTIVSFYSFDDNFENWWWYPERYVQKLLVSKTPFVVTPDWSMEAIMPKAECLWQLYRQRFVGRYIQESGVPVIPNVAWVDGDMEYLEKYVLATLPKKLPMIAMQMQTIDPDKVSGGIDHYKDQVEMVFQTLQPEAALIYGSELGREIVQTVNTGNSELLLLGTRLEAIEEATIGDRRKRKETI